MAVSSTMLSAVNKTGLPPAKLHATDNNSADSSPFGVMLAATQHTKQQADKTNAPSHDDNDAAKQADAQFSSTAQRASKKQNDAAASRPAQAKPADAGSVDAKSTDSKTADKDDNAANDNTSAQPAADAQSQTAQQTAAQTDPGTQATAQIQVAQLATAMQAQAALPPQAIPADAADTDSSGSQAVAAASTAGNSNKPSPQPAAASASQTADNPTAADADIPQTTVINPPSGNTPKTPVTAGQATIKGVGNSDKATSTSQNNSKTAPQSDSTAPQQQTQAQPSQQQTQSSQSQPAQPPQQAQQTQPPSDATTSLAAGTAANPATPAQGPGNVAVATSIHVAAQPPGATPNLNTLAVAIAAKTQSGARQFDIRLDPPELGRVEVRLSIDASGKTEAHMTADQQDTLNLLQKDSSSLTQALRDAGLNVSQGGLNFSLRGGQNGQSGQGDGQGQRSNLTASRTIDAAQDAVSANSFTGGASDARLDIHV